jgi:ATP-dependent DNA helicase RecG
MNKEELIKKLEDIEWEDFEVKEAKSNVPKSSWETVSAFSNTNGGWLIFGVKQTSKNKNKFQIIGVSNPEKVSSDFLTILSNTNKFNKRINVNSKKYNINSKTVLAFYIPAKSAFEKPIYFNSVNNTFIRTGSGDRRATKEEIDSFYRNSSFGDKDKEFTNKTIVDLDEETIKQYRNYFLYINPTHRYNGLSNEEFLEKLGVLRNNKVNFAGLLVFGKEDVISELIPQYRIEYLEINGISYETAEQRYNYRISSESNLYQTFFLIYERLIKKIDVGFSIKQGVRDDDPVHLQAIREALINFIIHTDYFSKANSRIRVFTDRYEFYNPGALPKKLEFILKEDFSLPRNPIIAKIFRLLKFSENIGSGFNKMISGWYSKYKFKPIINGDFDYYKITFPLLDLSKSSKSVITPVITDTMTDTMSDTNSQRNKEKEIFDFISNNPRFTLEEIGKYVGLTARGVRYHTDKLKRKGKIKRVGFGKKGYWEINK